MATVDDILNRRQTLFDDTAAQQPAATVQTTAVPQQQAANNLPNNGNNVQPGGVTINAQQLAAEQAKPDTATPVTPIKQGSNSTPEQKAAGTVAPKGDLPKNGNIPAWLQEQVEMGKKAAKENLDAINEKENADNLAKIGNDAVKSTLPQAAKKADATASSPEEDLYKKAYDDYMRFLEDDDKRIADEEERMKRNRLMTTIGDGLRAMHEAYSYGRGIAPDSGGVSLSGKWRERMDKLEAERKANRLAHMNAWYNMNKQRLDEQRYRQREDRYDRQQDRLEAQANLAIRKQDWLEKYQQGILDDKKERADIERQYKQGLITKMDHDMAISELNAQTRYYNAHKKDGQGGGSSSVTETYDILDANGNKIGRRTVKSPGGRGSGGRSSGSTGGDNKRKLPGTVVKKTTRRPLPK